MTAELTVAIAGGGIGGLAAAVALRRAGLTVLVIERTERIDDVGAGLILYPNGVRAAEAISPTLGSAVRAAGHVATPGQSRPVLTPKGEVLAVHPIGDLGRLYGAPHISLLRTTLQRLLYEEAQAAGVVLRNGVRVEDHAGHDGRVDVMLSDGTTLEVDLLVGADGIHSGVRRRLLGDGPPVYRGYTTLRGRSPAPADHPYGFVVSGQGLGLFTAPIGGGQLYWTAKIVAPAGVWPAKDRTTALADLAQELTGWHEPVLRMIADVEPPGRVVVTDISDRDPISRWTWGRVTLLGDAAHPMSPELGQGANTALEDAVVLARHLGGDTGVRTALAAYSAERAPRAAKIVRHSRSLEPAAAKRGTTYGFSTQEEQFTELYGWEEKASVR